jgi:hypothetical protein
MKTSFYAICLVSAVVLVPLIASAQIKTGTGTLVILNSSQEEIVVAADSRMHMASAHRDFDDRCKITAFGDELIVAAAGTTYSFAQGGRVVLWDAHTIARKIFDGLSKERTQEPTPLRFAKAWGNEVKEKLKADLVRDRQETLQGVPGNLLANAIFAGFYHGSPFIVVVEITFSITDNGQIETEFSLDTFEEPVWEMIGHSDVAYELFEGRTDRAHEWWHDMKARIRKDDDPIAFVTIDAVRFSMANQPLEKIGNEMVQPIGGPIDAVRLKRTGGIDWIQRKENCPSN